MQDDFSNEGVPVPGLPIDPVAMARRDLKKALPKRFYTDVTVEPRDGGFAILLDGRPVKTPAKNALTLPTRSSAEAVAAEWRAVQDYIDPQEMPLTRLVHSALDGVAGEKDACVTEVAKYAGSDLVCYRAGEPDSLVKAQAEAWEPYLDFAHQAFGARFICAEGVVFAAQPDGALRAVHAAVTKLSAPRETGALALAALNVMTTLSGSALMALAIAHGAFTPEAAWQAAHVDEDYQMKLWGTDEEALERRARRWFEMEAAARLFHLIHDKED